MITYQTYPPNCCANPGSRWLCEVRNNGWIADWRHFDTEVEAQTWGSQHKGEISRAATNAVVEMAVRWANK